MTIWDEINTHPEYFFLGAIWLTAVFWIGLRSLVILFRGYPPAKQVINCYGRDCEDCEHEEAEPLDQAPILG